MFKKWLEAQIAYHFVIPKVKNSRRTFTVDADTEEPSSPKVNHKPWDECMKKYVSRGSLEGIDLNVVDYLALAADPKFEEYKAILSSAELSELSPNEQLALYINAYNCLCIGLIIDHYKESGSLPVSIQNLTTGKPSVWDKVAGNVGGEEVSLNHIEHKVLRNKWAEPRVHASIVCASISCPDLRNEAFFPHKVDSQMTDQFTEWMKNEKKGLSIIDKSKRKVGMSKIFMWFANDFTVKGSTNLKDYVNQFLSGDSKELVSRKAKPSLEYFDYNWHLNNKA